MQLLHLTNYEFSTERPQNIIHPFFDPLIVTRDVGHTGAYSSCLSSVAGEHPELVASQSLGRHSYTTLQFWLILGVSLTCHVGFWNVGRIG